MDDKTITLNQLIQLEKETKELETRVLSKVPSSLLEVMRYLYSNNTLGVRPSYSNIAIELNLSRPTARKRIKELIATGYVRENKIGRQKLLKLTQKGFNLFIQN